MTVYTLKEFEDLERLHIFEGKVTQVNPLKCNTASTPKSCCGKIEQADYKHLRNEFSCQSAKSTLELCIKSTSAICASCEEHVFKRFQEQVGRL